MSFVEDWQPGVLSGRPERWNWREMWKPCGPSLASSGQSSRTVGESGRRPWANSASKTSGSASSWPRWDGPGPWGDGNCCTGPQLGGGSVDRLGWWLQTVGWLHCPPPPQASRTEQELQRELDTLRGQCQTQALAEAELRARLESLQAEVSSSWGSPRLAQAAPCPYLRLISDIWPQNQMLQDRRQDLEAQIRGLREEVDKGQGRLQTTHEELLLLRRERKEHRMEVIRGAGGGAASWARAAGFLGDMAGWITKS